MGGRVASTCRFHCSNDSCALGVVGFSVVDLPRKKPTSGRRASTIQRRQRISCGADGGVAKDEGGSFLGAWISKALTAASPHWTPELYPSSTESRVSLR